MSRKNLKALADELREAHGPGDDGEYAFLKAIYQKVETAKSLADAEDRLREMQRYVSSCYGYVHGHNRFKKKGKKG
jgi:hypothetical protein